MKTYNESIKRIAEQAQNMNNSGFTTMLPYFRMISFIYGEDLDCVEFDFHEELARIGGVQGFKNDTF